MWTDAINGVRMETRASVPSEGPPGRPRLQGMGRAVVSGCITTCTQLVGTIGRTIGRNFDPTKRVLKITCCHETFSTGPHTTDVVHSSRSGPDVPHVSPAGMQDTHNLHHGMTRYTASPAVPSQDGLKDCTVVRAQSACNAS